jgi:hypothetical protein
MHTEMPMAAGEQLFWLSVLSIPVACVARTVTAEELFREPREWCRRRSEACRRLAARKFFYLFTCEYCFSHYVAAGFVAATGFRLLLPDWRGFVLAVFAVVFVANLYLNLYARLRVDVRRVRTEADRAEASLARGEDGTAPPPAAPDGRRRVAGAADGR